MGDQDKEESLDLLIFKYRGMKSPSVKPKTEKQPAIQQPGQQEPEIQQPAAVHTEEPVQAKPVQKAAPQRPPRAEQAAAPKNVEGFCINHPWRRAYATCEICRLPYCYAEIMEHNGRYYCLSDIDTVMNSEGIVAQQPHHNVNVFSIVAAVLLLVNSAVLGVFTYPQIGYVLASALKTGVIAFATHLNPLYYSSLENAFIIMFGLLAAIGITRKSQTVFAISFTVVFTSLFIIVDEYLNNSSAYYFLPSGMLLVIIVMFSAYSRMSAFSETEMGAPVSSMNWPRPGPY